MASYKGRAGVWMVYSQYEDALLRALSLHETAVQAAEAATSSGNRIGFWPLGFTLRDAVLQWEDGPLPDPTKEDSYPQDTMMFHDEETANTVISILGTIRDSGPMDLQTVDCLNLFKDHGIVFRRVGE